MLLSFLVAIVFLAVEQDGCEATFLAPISCRIALPTGGHELLFGSSPSDSEVFSGFTENMAYDPARRSDRTRPDLDHGFSLLYQIQSLASFLTFALGIQIGATVVLLLFPSLLYRQLLTSSSGVENISTADGGSRTAILALWARAQMYRMGAGGPDSLAPKLLEKLSFFGRNVPGSRTALSVCGALSRVNFQLTSKIFEDQIAYLLTLLNTGLVVPNHVRTCWLDDCVEAFVQSIGGGEGNLVILGAGFDSRCYRLTLQKRNVNTFEVDARGTQKEKQRILEEIGIDASNVNFCSCDFETQDWEERLAKAGMKANLPTLFILEGVTMYLSRSSVVHTLQRVAKYKNRLIAFDYIESIWAMSPSWRRAMKRVGEPFQFSMSNSEPEELVASCGLTLVEHLRDEDELTNRYVPSIQGRPIGHMGQYGGFVVAASS